MGDEDKKEKINALLDECMGLLSERLKELQVEYRDLLKDAEKLRAGKA